MGEPLLKQNEIRQFNDDGISLWGLKKPARGEEGGISQTYSVWFESNPREKFFLVYINDPAGGSPFTYHSHARDAVSASKEALRQKNLEEYPAYVRELTVWLRSVNPTFTWKDAQDAGFCMLGVRNLFSKYHYGESITGHKIIAHMTPDGEDFAEPAIGAMVYSCYMALP